MEGMGRGLWGFGMFLWPVLLTGLLIWLGYAIGRATGGLGHERVRATERRDRGDGHDAQ